MKRRILLGVTGGIAAYKAAELARLLQKNNVEVQVAMTEAGTKFVTPATFQALTGKPVITNQWDASFANNMAHIELSRGVEAIVIAPATADFMAKVANGLADDLLSTVCIARNCPLLVAPAMNREMWDNPATQRNVATLRTDGIAVLGPAAGDQACGETGMGRMLEPEELLQSILAFLAPKSLAGKKVLITAGPTFEAIDTVRGITNLSSGRMGYALAEAAASLGADVTLVSGPTSLSAPHGAHFVYVTSAAEMFNAVKSHVAGTDLFFGVAAVADYTPVQPSNRKLKKSAEPLDLKLKPTEDILAYVAQIPGGPFCVGFAAESENLAGYAQAKRAKKKIPMIVANLVQHTIGKEENEVTIYDDAGAHTLSRAPKSQIAHGILAHAIRLFEARSPGATVTPIKQAS
ncbi:bifunctional phosphopantothenoylcysteine decarboxylase/phosphopantothenate--cysteine ligase CoaBC [Usitatibacter palustris]|uniref:bifunctional phosphopantothenoylcysteine decarboxylase/phosphopantothenate--cysteine ligase CoaBC n=1 Tax=Usitatibacter palustris TaxID=2732487 RepID=UPI0031B63756